ncbi:MAG: phosphotransferase [Acidimicrobiales bacterium]|nr:phosphotransferase [Acidimicrobiales bacterium]
MPPADPRPLGPGEREVLDDPHRLRWLAGRPPAPEMVAARPERGPDAVVVRMHDDATAASEGHPLGPEAMAEALAAALTELHRLPVPDCPFDASTAALRTRAAQTPLAVAQDGPYAGRDHTELLAVHDELTAADSAGSAFIHGGLRADRVWFAPDGRVTFTGWHAAGIGDPHVDLAAAAAIVTDVHGPALVAPMLAGYGLDRIDVRRLDAAQLLVHLLG